MRNKPFDEEYYNLQNTRSASDLNNNVIAKYLHLIGFVPGPAVRVLDVGCRKLASTVELFHRMGCDSYGCDIGELAEAGWSSLPFKNNLKRADIHDGVPFEGLFDIISISHTLEHCHNPELVLAHLKKSLSPDGHLWSIVPVEHKDANHTPHYNIFHSHQEHMDLYIRMGFDIAWDQRQGVDSRLWLKHKIEE